MSLLERMGLIALHRLEPELAHKLSLRALNLGLTPKPGPITSPRLKTDLAGLSLPNPIGLAAGFDKNAEAVAPLLQSGFGFIEVGAATPIAQDGNPKPRLFRLTEDRAAINRFSFNNEGATAIAARLKQRPETGIVGLNLGANKTSADRAGDYVEVLKTCGDFVDFVTVNVSSPNTEKLRDLQGPEALSALLTNVLAASQDLSKPVPVFLKIAPDLSAAEITAIADIALATGTNAIIATNTTLARDGLQNPAREQMGGLSGAPLFARSTRVLAQLARDTRGEIPLIGVGGIGSAEQAYVKIKAGASAVQLYTAMVYQGIGLVAKIARELDQLLARDGFANVADAVGVERDRY
ncbi:MAG: quinone-dependent dihydroorotate dehydrogenase [Alphaproteobacteria bacterium]|nr:quinone-dependent dihydroorotate dehydrogenase [Alphaproteobacteria bacterium]